MLSVLENAVMVNARRAASARFGDSEPFYRRALDGVLPWEPRPAGAEAADAAGAPGGGESS